MSSLCQSKKASKPSTTDRIMPAVWRNRRAMTSGRTGILNACKMFSHNTRRSKGGLAPEPDVRFLRHTLPMSVTNRLMAERCFCDDCELISVVVGTELGEVAGRAVSGGVGGQAREVPAGIRWCAN